MNTRKLRERIPQQVSTRYWSCNHSATARHGPSDYEIASKYMRLRKPACAVHFTFLSPADTSSLYNCYNRNVSTILVIFYLMTLSPKRSLGRISTRCNAHDQYIKHLFTRATRDAHHSAQLRWTRPREGSAKDRLCLARGKKKCTGCRQDHADRHRRVRHNECEREPWVSRQHRATDLTVRILPARHHGQQLSLLPSQWSLHTSQSTSTPVCRK